MGQLGTGREEQPHTATEHPAGFVLQTATICLLGGGFLPGNCSEVGLVCYLQAKRNGGVKAQW